MPQMGFRRVLHCFLLCSAVLARELPPIFWNSTNSIFRIDNTDHVITAKILDRIDFICPHRETGDPEAGDFLEIYMVPKNSYETCTLPRRQDRMKRIGVCSSPTEAGSKITVAFREFTPNPDRLEFRAGESYYFTTTSSGDYAGMKNKKGGLCWKANMKIKVEIEPDSRFSAPYVPPSSQELQAPQQQQNEDYNRYRVDSSQPQLIADQPRPPGDDVTYVITEEYWSDVGITAGHKRPRDWTAPSVYSAGSSTSRTFVTLLLTIGSLYAVLL